jgi:D-cysteine desulfhydrase
MNNTFLLLDNIEFDGLSIKVVRDDLFPFIGGGGKARKAVEYETMLREGGYNAFVTCGGIQSNHNRAMALMAARNGWKCYLCIQGTEERFLQEKGNALLNRLSGAECELIRPEDTAEAMDRAMGKLKADDFNPYYVHGGGHDLPGGTSFVKAIEELKRQCESENYKPDFIFHASGTGSTQAGIVVGLEKVGWGDVKVVGISVARQQERGKQVIAEFANMLGDHYGMKKDFTDDIIFCTDYLYGGYEQYTSEMADYLERAMKETGLMFDTTYSGKGFYGMMDYVKKNHLEDKNNMFWHTGGLMNLMK